MKKLLTMLVLATLVLGLAGCENATANISEKNTMLIKVGKTTLTKGQLYENMLNDDAANKVVAKALEMIAEAEIETTAEIQAKADEIYNDYRQQIAATTEDDFAEAIKDYGFEDLDAFKAYCLNNAKSKELSNKYIEDNWDSIIEEYYPVKARLMYFNGSESMEVAMQTAETALAEVKAGADFETVAQKYSSNASQASEQLYTRNSESLDYNVLQFILGSTSPTLSQVITNKDSNGYYIVQITNANQAQLKDEFIALLQNDTSFGDNVVAHYFKKHNFVVYDIDVYNTIKENYPAYLVQETGPKTDK